MIAAPIINNASEQQQLDSREVQPLIFLWHLSSLLMLREVTGLGLKAYTGPSGTGNSAAQP